MREIAEALAVLELTADLDIEDPRVLAVLQREYDRVLPRLTEIYERLDPTDKERVDEADSAFHSGKPEALIAWARTVLPGAFADIETYEPSPVQAVQTKPLEPPPEGPLYHGTRDAKHVLYLGLQQPPAYGSVGGDPDYGWSGLWRSEMYSVYRRLDPKMRRDFHQQLGFESGRLLSAETLGEMVSLFWVTTSLQTAQRYGRGHVFEVDASQLSYYWWFGDEMEKNSYVFVMPSDGPQAPPSAFKLVEGPEAGHA